MTAIATINKEISGLVTEVDNHITENDLDHICFNPPFFSLINLGDVAAFTSAVPSLAALFEELNLTIKSIGLNTVYYNEKLGTWENPFIIIPLRNFDGISVRTYELNADATPKLSKYNIEYFDLDQATETSSVSLEDGKVYFVNCNVYHSFRYDRSDLPTPTDLSGCGVLLLIGVEEDMSAYLS